MVSQSDLETWHRRLSQLRTEHAEEGRLDSPGPWDTPRLLSYRLLDLLITSRIEWRSETGQGERAFQGFTEQSVWDILHSEMFRNTHVHQTSRESWEIVVN